MSSRGPSYHDQVLVSLSKEKNILLKQQNEDCLFVCISKGLDFFV